MKVANSLKDILLFFQSIIKLSRFKTSLLVGLTCGCGYVLQITTSPTFSLHPSIFFACIGSGFFSMASMNTLNDLVDVENDKIVKPERVIPQGLITPRQALLLTILEMTLGLAMLTYLGVSSAIIGTSMLIFGILYSLFLQSYPIIKNVLVGFSVSSALLIGALAASKTVSFKVIIIFLSAFIVFTAFELHKDIGDISGDMNSGKKTLPIVIGLTNAFRVSFFLYGLGFMIVIIGLAMIPEPFWLILSLTIVGTGALLSISPSLKTTDPKQIKRERILMMSTFAFILLLFLFESFLQIFASLILQSR